MKVYSVGELTQAVKALLEDGLPVLWVEGEISDYTVHRSGHHYFTLKDSESVLSCVMWRGRSSALGFTPKPGMKVLAQGRITVYEKGGRYQFEVWALQLSGEGELMIAFERMKAKLAAEGLFDSRHKKPIPRFPASIGIVTSPTGAAVRDLASVIRRRNPGVELILKPVRVQGEGAAEEIAKAIDAFNRFGSVDLLIVGRGGGSLEDLWPFNEEIVARAIFASKIPVISAVGHEIDFSIADLTADLRAPTPSAAGELAVPDSEELKRRISDSRYRMKTALKTRIDNYRNRLEWVRRSRGLNRPLDIVRQYAQQVDELRRRMDSATAVFLDKRRNRIDRITASLNALNPRNVLKRGYSICRKLPEMEIVTEAEKLNRSDRLDILFASGSAIARVEKTEESRLMV
ncbi:exodeoxyribonuclease VII large subunit [bacterium]|nr:exodeoxyribonuclease VII large subunit [FCB group bacterium]MBL7190661.1 exodeoxyribonuclease VII large subunit [bacterium]